MSGRTSIKRQLIRAAKTNDGKAADAYAAGLRKRAKVKDSQPASVQVQGLMDQCNERSVLLTQNGAQSLIRLDIAIGHSTELAKAAAKDGVILAESNLRNDVLRQIGLIKEWPQTVYVVRQPGLHCGCFVKPDGTYRGRPTVEHLQVALLHPVALAMAGTIEGWWALIIRFVTGQSLLILSLCSAFLGPLLEVMLGWDNVLVELVSTTSTGKTTILSVASTVWGAPHRRAGSISKSLRATANGIEENMLARSGAFCPLNEVNLLGSEKQLGDLLGDIAFLLEEGAAKDRMGQQSLTPARLCVQANSNRPVAELMRGQSAERIDAVRVRLASVSADVGKGLGSLDVLPDGFTDPASAINALRDGLLEHHGHAIDLFLDRLAAELASDRDRLIRTISWWENRFIVRCGVDRNNGPAFRRACIFARLHAAGQLASRWGVLPIRGILSAILACYRRSLADDPPATSDAVLSAIQRVQQYVEANRDSLADLNHSEPIALTDAELDACPGFLKRRLGQHCIFVRTERWQQAFGSDANRMLSELDREHRLQVTDGFQLQTRVRSNRSKDRVYAIVLDTA